MLPEYNLNELIDGDLVIYEDFDVEFKHNSNKIHTSPRMVPDKRLPYGTKLKPMTHCANKNKPSEISCFIVKTTDNDYDYWDSMQGTPYGYSNMNMH